MADLPSLHRDLIATIDELEALTQRATCDEAALTAVRYRLTRLSSARRRMVQALCDRLKGEATQDAAILTLAALGPANRVVSSAHIASWSLGRILGDWPGYCQASATMRASMRRQIEAEAAALYPYLDDGGSAQASAGNGG